MPSSAPGSIYISYAQRDGAALAQRLQADLIANGFNVWLDQRRLTTLVGWTPELEHEIDAREVTVALLTPDAYESDVCRAELVRALRREKRVVPILAAGGMVRSGFIEDRQFRDFGDAASYGENLRGLVADIHSGDSAKLTVRCRTTQVTFLTAPPRIANYIERPDIKRALRDTLFAGDGSQPVVLTSVSGVGGIGNTTLAKALIEDDVVQQAFPDGVVWITVGKESGRDFIREMRDIAKALGNDLSRVQNALSCEKLYRATIADVAALIVMDDVWNKSDIEPLIAASPRSRFLVTTRDSATGISLGARQHPSRPFDHSQSRELLAAWAKFHLKELPHEADDIIEECAGLPLALSVVGATLRDADPPLWRGTLIRLRTVDLSPIQEKLPVGQDNGFRAIGLGFEALAPRMQERYLALAVLLEDMAAPLTVLRTLWNTTEVEASQISRHFVERSLAQGDGVGDAIRLHDLQLDYMRARHPDSDALKLIHGAMRLSRHVISKDPAQFASQVVGRLLPLQDFASIERFTNEVSQGTPTAWLRSLWPTLRPPGTSYTRTLKGHSDGVRGVAVSNDGRRAVSASGDETLKVWDVESGRELRTLEGHTDMVYSVALTGDARYAISASMDETLKVWDVESGRELRTLEGHFAAVNTVALSGDGRRAVSGSSDHTIKVWDVGGGQELHTLLGHTDVVTAVAMSADGSRAVSASLDQTLRVWDVEGERETLTLHGHSDVVYGVVLSGDGQVAISCSADKTLKSWDMVSGQELCTLEGHTGIVRGVALSADGRRAISASEDRTLRVWDMMSGRERCSLQGHTDLVYGVAVTADGQQAISASRDKTLMVWDVETGRELRTVEGHSDAVTAVAASGDGRRTVSASRDKTLKVWEVESGHELRTLKGHSEAVTAVAVSKDGQRAISASEDQTLIVWDVESGRELRTLKGHSDYVVGVAVSADGQRAISASGDETLKVWDVESGRLLRTLDSHAPYIYGVAVSGDGRKAISAAGDETLQVWDVEAGCALHTMDGHSGWVYSVALSGDGQRAVSASRDKALKVWDVASGRELLTVDDSSDYVGVAVSQDGRLAAASSLDQTVKVWNVESGVLLAAFTCDAAAWCCAFISDHELTAGDVEGRVYLLRLEVPSAKS